MGRFVTLFARRLREGPGARDRSTPSEPGPRPPSSSCFFLTLYSCGVAVDEQAMRAASRHSPGRAARSKARSKPRRSRVPSAPSCGPTPTQFGRSGSSGRPTRRLLGKRVLDDRTRVLHQLRRRALFVPDYKGRSARPLRAVACALSRVLLPQPPLRPRGAGAAALRRRSARSSDFASSGSSWACSSASSASWAPSSASSSGRSSLLGVLLVQLVLFLGDLRRLLLGLALLLARLLLASLACGSLTSSLHVERQEDRNARAPRATSDTSPSFTPSS